jgi:hypothetical protein
MPNQPKITQFLKPLANQQQPPPPRIKRLRQSLINDFFGPEADRRRKLAAKKEYQKRYSSVRKFNRDFHLHNRYDQMLGSVNCLCYCRNDYLFYVVDPTTNMTIAELQLDSDHWMEHVHVDSEYQKRSIGSKMVFYANQFCLQEGTQEHGIAICVGVVFNTRYRLTGEGAALVNSCLRKGILKDEQVFYETPPSPGY